MQLVLSFHTCMIIGHRISVLLSTARLGLQFKNGWIFIAHMSQEHMNPFQTGTGLCLNKNVEFLDDLSWSLNVELLTSKLLNHLPD